jgi:2-polyprenyl-6-methoxyphenol hydroxylase-like FAD-dependent oxidoreductase
MHDVAIIGAGPAGAIAAIALRRFGLDILLIEQHRFPRDKVCGECLSSVGIDVLAELGLAAIVAKLLPVELTRVLVHAGDGSNFQLNLPRAMWGISRHAMDQVLFESACETRQSPGEKKITIMQPARVEFIAPGHPPSIRVRDLVSNTCSEISAKYLIVADGKGALLPDRPKATTDLGVKTHFANVDGPRDAIDLFGVDGHYGGLAPIEGDRWNAAFSIPAAMVAKFRGEFDSLFEQLLRQNRILKMRLANATRIGPWLTSPLPRFAVARTWPAGVIPIGNAAAALEPIGGEGMGLAMRSAVLAARHIGQALQSDREITARDIEKIQTDFRGLWSLRRAACRSIALMISNPLAAEAMTAIAGGEANRNSSSANIARIALSAMGKSEHRSFRAE